VPPVKRNPDVPLPRRKPVPAQPSPRPAAAARGHTAANLIYAALRDDIVAMRMAPGEPINEKAVALKHGVSRTPVREALLRLAGERLVEIFPQSGTFVTRIPIAALPEAILVRKALEELTAREAALNATGGQLVALRQSIDRQQMLARQGDRNRFHDADDAFHAAVADAAGRPGIWRLILQVKLQLDRYRRLTLPVPGRMNRVVDEHAAVVAAIASHDPTAAGTAMAAHLDGLSASMRDVRDLNPKYFDVPPEDR
jgi:GntR family transcriptional regulator, rspAB operon transcriptional repressor